MSDRQPTYYVIRSLLSAGSTLGVPPLDAEMILLWALGLDASKRAWLRSHSSDRLPPETSSIFLAACKERTNGVPLAHLLGERGFYGLTLYIDPRVLDPRPDTETLVDWALEVLAGIAAPHVADLGTGSGAIALAIQHQRPDACVWAVDASTDALEVARANAQRLGLGVQFAHGSWLGPLPDAQLDLIVSNPPYIAEGDPHLPALRHEPIMALTSGPDGLDAIRHIVHGAPRALRPGGWLLLEHGYDQGEAVDALLKARGFSDVTSKRDLSDHVRCTGGRWLGAHTTDNQRL